jgi:hypothetical protein
LKEVVDVVADEKGVVATGELDQGFATVKG